MASLEELLSREGFKRGKSKQSSYGSPASKDSRLPPYSTRNRISSVDQRARRDRSKSDAFSRRSWSSEGGRSQGQDLRRSILQRKSSAGVYRRESPKIRGFDIESYSEEESNEKYQVQYPDSFEESDEDDLPKEQGNLHTERFQQNDNEFPEAEKLERSTDTVKDDARVSDLKLDEIGAKAIISILTGYLRRFFKDENFRASLYQSCASCLGINESYENDQSEDGVIDNLNQAIRVVERTAVGSPSSQELKRAALQLSVITGLSSGELKDGFSSGIPNLELAACAHIYLSIIYKFQKKDKVSAKHLLHVFCDSPNQARTKLLPVLWDRLIFAHLSHLREWYDSEAEVIARSPSGLKKMKLLEEMYSNVLDVGTYRFGVYYKEWLDDEAEDPELPSIVAPQGSFMWMPRETSGSFDSDEFSSPGSSASSQAKVSKKLYESVFRQSKKKFKEVDQMGVWKDKENEEVAVVVEEIDDDENNKPMFGSERQGDKITGAYYLNMGRENFQEDYRDSPTDDIQSYHDIQKAYGR
ncbi:uncharacterized protein A4U43_C04F4090 [Asparagus officinalis]|uniref:Putative E3 ubiquitin-protein ligase LIN N-terminal domain-containing protein n=1 Tax=Asparagus officinalis TaxID=4686 RepID=A0A5P1F3K4_ASPOF|nr:uncharacterized protein A4U43_C04F4090 [Asparagus officinalis]